MKRFIRLTIVVLAMLLPNAFVFADNQVKPTDETICKLSLNINEEGKIEVSQPTDSNSYLRLPNDKDNVYYIFTSKKFVEFNVKNTTGKWEWDYSDKNTTSWERQPNDSIQVKNDATYISSNSRPGIIKSADSRGDIAITYNKQEIKFQIVSKDPFDFNKHISIKVNDNDSVLRHFSDIIDVDTLKNIEIQRGFRAYMHSIKFNNEELDTAYYHFKVDVLKYFEDDAIEMKSILVIDSFPAAVCDTSCLTVNVKHFDQNKNFTNSVKKIYFVKPQVPIEDNGFVAIMKDFWWVLVVCLLVILWWFYRGRKSRHDAGNKEELPGAEGNEPIDAEAKKTVDTDVKEPEKEKTTEVDTPEPEAQVFQSVTDHKVAELVLDLLGKDTLQDNEIKDKLNKLGLKKVCQKWNANHPNEQIENLTIENLFEIITRGYVGHDVVKELTTPEVKKVAEYPEVLRSLVNLIKNDSYANGFDNAKTEITKKDEEIKKLTDQNKQLESDNKKLKEDNGALTTENQELNEKIKDLNATINSQQREFAEKKAAFERQAQIILDELRTLPTSLNECNYVVELTDVENTDAIEIIGAVKTSIEKGVDGDKQKAEIEKLIEEKNALNDRIKELEKSIKIKEESHAQEIAELKESYNQEIQLLKEGHDKKIEALKKDHDKDMNALEAKYETEISELKEAYTQKIQALEEAHAQEIAAIVAKYEEQISGLKEVHDRAIKVLKDEHAHEIAVLKEYYGKEIETLEAKYETEISKLKESHTKEIQALKEAHAQEIATIVAKYEKQISELKEAHVQEIKAFENKISDLNNIIDEKDATIEQKDNELHDDCELYIDQVLKLSDNVKSMINHLYETTTGAGNNMYINVIKNAQDSFDRFADKVRQCNNERWQNVSCRRDNVCADLQVLIKPALREAGWVNIISYLNLYAGTSMEVNDSFRERGLVSTDLSQLFAEVQRLLGMFGVKVVVPKLLTDTFDEAHFAFDNADLWISAFAPSLQPRDYTSRIFDMSCIGYQIGDNEYVKPKVFFNN